MGKPKDPIHLRNKDQTIVGKKRCKGKHQGTSGFGVNRKCGIMKYMRFPSVGFLAYKQAKKDLKLKGIINTAHSDYKEWSEKGKALRATPTPELVDLVSEKLDAAIRWNAKAVASRRWRLLMNIRRRNKGFLTEDDVKRVNDRVQARKQLIQQQIDKLSRASFKPSENFESLFRSEVDDYGEVPRVPAVKEQRKKDKATGKRKQEAPSSAPPKLIKQQDASGIFAGETGSDLGSEFISDNE